MSPTQEQIPFHFHVMTKPIGPLCNLDCKYCFYLEKEKLYPETHRWKMTEEVLENYVRQYIESQDVPEIEFAWQGGEPTLMGLDFFRKVVEFQRKYANGKHINNAFQTNGTRIDDEWADFFARNGFLIGVSIDGPEDIHNHYRVDKRGGGSFENVVRGIEFLKKHGAEFNTLTVVQRYNSQHPQRVYKFLRQIGSGFMQFIPIAERLTQDEREDHLTLVKPGERAHVTEWSVDPVQYGKFLSAIFDEWVRHDVGRIYVQIFDTALQAWLGQNPSLCVFSETCGRGVAMEHNGDLYSCDHYVYPENRLGNIMEKSVRDMVLSEQQVKFGNDKRDALPDYCRKCPWYFTCHGGCPKHRFITTPTGDPGLNYLCAGYKHIFQHIDPHMRFMASELRAGRPPANIMRFLEMQDMQKMGQMQPQTGRIKPNDPCVCGSGRKYKKCCGRVAKPL